MTVTRTHKAYMRGAIWMLALVGLIMLPGFSADKAEADPMQVLSR
jgi:hypothetical protein